MDSFICDYCKMQKTLQDVVIEENLKAICAFCMSIELKIREKISQEIQHAAEVMGRYDEYSCFDLEIMEYASDIAKGKDNDKRLLPSKG